jgi:hypothetical protein
MLLLGGRAVPAAGRPLEIHEATALDFSFAKGVDGHLLLGGVAVPLLEGRADPVWVTDSRKEQWVGELDLVLVTAGPAGPGGPGGVVVRPRVVMLPKRATMEGFAFLVEQFRAWAGAGALSDPAGRARIWAELAPRVPRREEERALVALALLRKALPAFVAIHRAPATAPAERWEWSPLERTGGRRLLLRRLHSFDPPRPFEAPRHGTVATVVVEPSPDRDENRFVAGTVRRLLAMAREAAAEVAGGPSTTPAQAGFDPDLGRELTETTRTLEFLSAEAPWAGLASGPAPRVSFLLRDHPHYRAFRGVADALDDSLRFSPLPGDPAALGVRTQTLNALFEVWVAQAVRAAVRRRLGLAAPLPAPLPRGGAEEAVTAGTAGGRVRVCFDRVYPRTGDEIIALTRKRSPDVSVEWWPLAGRPVVMAVDATWSRNPIYHDDKLGYARSLAQGGSDPMLGAPRLVARRSVVVFPGPVPQVQEVGFALSLATVSAPPSAAGWALLGDFLDRALEGVIPPGLSADGFSELAELRARSNP